MAGAKDSDGIRCYEELDSTNSFASGHFAELPDRGMVVAWSQTAGRGRRGRTWASPAGVNVYASFVMKNLPFPAHKASWIGGLAALDTFREAAPELAFWIKWPNDIFVGARKIAGVLCEGHVAAAGGSLDGVVIGVGANVNMSAEQLRGVDKPATSLLAETGKAGDLEKFAAALASKLNLWYNTAFSSGMDGVHRRWKMENALLGRKVDVQPEGVAAVSGKAVDITADGELVVVTADGCFHRFAAGDVSVSL